MDVVSGILSFNLNVNLDLFTNSSVREMQKMEFLALKIPNILSLKIFKFFFAVNGIWSCLSCFKIIEQRFKF